MTYQALTQSPSMFLPKDKLFTPLSGAQHIHQRATFNERSSSRNQALLPPSQGWSSCRPSKCQSRRDRGPDCTIQSRYRGAIYRAAYKSPCQPQYLTRPYRIYYGGQIHPPACRGGRDSFEKFPKVKLSIGLTRDGR
jgi:hypothetical protein